MSKIHIQEYIRKYKRRNKISLEKSRLEFVEVSDAYKQEIKIQKKLQKKSIKKLQKKSTKKYIYEDRWKTLMYNNILYIKIIHII